MPNLTAEAQAREIAVDVGWDQKTGPEDLNNFHRCVTTGVPRLGGNFGTGPYTFYQLIQTPNYVVIVMEAFHDARIIPIAPIAPIDARPRLPDRIRQWNGDSRGHWEGDTLVVKTGNFSADSYFRGATANLELVERFTRTGDDTLTYELTFIDPTTWATSWTAETLLKPPGGSDLRVRLPRGESLARRDAADGASNGAAVGALLVGGGLR